MSYYVFPVMFLTLAIVFVCIVFVDKCTGSAGHVNEASKRRKDVTYYSRTASQPSYRMPKSNKYSLSNCGEQNHGRQERRERLKMRPNELSP